MITHSERVHTEFGAKFVRGQNRNICSDLSSNLCYDGGISPSRKLHREGGKDFSRTGFLDWRAGCPIRPICPLCKIANNGGTNWSLPGLHPSPTPSTQPSSLKSCPPCQPWMPTMPSLSLNPNAPHLFHGGNPLAISYRLKCEAHPQSRIHPIRTVFVSPIPNSML